MLAMLLGLIGQVPPPPPLSVIADHNPGPWFLPVDALDRFTVETDATISRVRDTVVMFPDIAITVCVERATPGPNDARDRRLLARIERTLRARGARDVRREHSRCPIVVPPRGADGVMLNPVPAPT